MIVKTKSTPYGLSMVIPDYIFDLKELKWKVKDKIEKKILSNRLSMLETQVSRVLETCEGQNFAEAKWPGKIIDFEGMEVLQPAETVFIGFNEFKED